MAFAVSDDALKVISAHEGLRHQLYNDPLGNCSIGIGHLVHPGPADGTEPAEFLAGITAERALELLREDVSDLAAVVNDAVDVELTQNQFDALVSFVRTCGVEAFRESDLLRELNQGNYDEVPNQLARWVHADGQVLLGLVSRRRVEAELWTGSPAGTSAGWASGGETVRTGMFRDGDDEPADEEPGDADGAAVPTTAASPDADDNEASGAAPGEGEAEEGEPEESLAGDTRSVGFEDVRGNVNVVPPDPPREAYALLQCPQAVALRQEFELLVGLSDEETPGVIGEKLRRPDSSLGPYTLTVNVQTDGFDIRDGESFKQKLWVTADEPYPSVVLHLTAADDEDLLPARTVMATFAVDGQIIGVASRSVSVHVRDADLPAPQEQPSASGVDFQIPTDPTPPDLTITITPGDRTSGGGLVWGVETHWPDIGFSRPVTSDIGEEPNVFAAGLVRGANAREGEPNLNDYLRGKGTFIADQMPEEVWLALRAVAAKTGDSPPSVLILSTEPFVPWELAVVDPPLDDEKPPFLGAQVTIGRWILREKRPTSPPLVEHAVSSMAVVSGNYKDVLGWRPLPHAEQEAATLAERYLAEPVNASSPEVMALLKAEPPYDTVHFSMHGTFDPRGIEDGLVLVDGKTLDPNEVRGLNLAQKPFVFLNACQVGTGRETLGDYAGMAEAFLYAGASAVVAPLWSIDDGVAQQIALRFYERTFDGAPVADVLRAEKASFGSGAEPNSGASLAYQFFGHPLLHLDGSDSMEVSNG